MEVGSHGCVPRFLQKFGPNTKYHGWVPRFGSKVGSHGWASIRGPEVESEVLFRRLGLKGGSSL
jgi:hypothetical protein